MLRLLTFATLCALAAFSFASGAARAQEPANFVIGTGCGPENTEARETFAVPTADETAALLANLGASGQPDQIWIDLTLFNNNFAPGTFIGAGAFVPGTIFTWEHMLTARVHFYRLNALVDGRWFELGRGRFETPNCSSILRMTCDTNGTTSVLFLLPQFRTAEGRPLETWIDLSLFNNGFARGTFIGAGPFPPPSNSPSVPPVSFLWSGIRGGQQHYFRYNVLLDDGGWDQQTFLGFLPLDCRNIPLVSTPA